MSDDRLYVVAYWGDDRDVAYVLITEETTPDRGYSYINTALRRYICDGHITEILEVAYGNNLDADAACVKWRDQLHEQGYYMNREGYRQGEPR